MKRIIGFILVGGLLFSQVLYEEYFTDGNMQLDWRPWFTDSLGIGDSMGVIADSTTPGGDFWAGRISNEYMGMAGVTYSGISSLTDYSIEAWIYTTVSAVTGPYNGIALRMDPATRYYYRFVSDFDADGRLRLGLIGSGGMPVVLKDWFDSEIPGGVPATSSWHKFKLTVIADSIWAYYDDQLLPECPIVNDSVSHGYFGIYVFNMADTASTKCDNIIVRAEESAVMENMERGVNGYFTIQPNPFTDVAEITIQYAGDIVGDDEDLKIFDMNGRVVKVLPPTYKVNGSTSVYIWNGRDNRDRILAPGVYFLMNANRRIADKIIKLP